MSDTQKIMAMLSMISVAMAAFFFGNQSAHNETLSAIAAHCTKGKSNE